MNQLLRSLQGEAIDLDQQEFAARKSANLMLWIIAGFFVLFLVWAGFTQLDRTVRGVGRVVPSSKLQVVSNLEGGVVEQLPALSDRVDRTTIRAPMSGKVNRVLVTTVGGSVGAGTPIAEIVPSEQTLYVEAPVRPSDIANVRLGQKAGVEITAYNSAVFGQLDGKVTAISRLGETAFRE